MIEAGGAGKGVVVVVMRVCVCMCVCVCVCVREGVRAVRDGLGKQVDGGRAQVKVQGCRTYESVPSSVTGEWQQHI